MTKHIKKLLVPLSMKEHQDSWSSVNLAKY